MIRRIRDLVGLNATGPSTKSLLDVRPRQVQVQPAMLETSQEIAVYVHRFHNLDLFQQGWYQIKISTRWEDEIHGFPGTPARVVQYEVPDLGIDDNSGVWMIDDIDHSFSTQPFHVKYSRQDVLLSVMVSFNLALPRYEICPSASAVILKFELLYAPMLGNGFELQTSVELSPASVHEFRIPPIALLGLHTYCPVHFDAFHSVLIDLSVHTVLLKTGSISPSRKTHKGDDIGGYTEQNQIYQKDYGGSTIPTLIKALSTSRDILLEELQRLSKAIDPALDVLSDIDSNSSGVKKVDSSTDTLNRRESQITNNIEREGPSPLSSEDLVETFHSLGAQLSVMWNTFLNFHRANRTKILEYLYDIWANDRRTEWSIWMVHSVIDIPHRYLKSGDESLHQSLSGRHSISRKSNDDQPHIATMRADLHRRSIAQMKINNRFIQDMQIFGDPSRIPVILVEQNVTNLSSQSVIELELKETLMRQMESCTKPLFKRKHVTPRKNNRVLRAAVFVHGFQGHHLDLRLVRNQWLLIDPGADCLMSMANEDRTSDDFREMGNRLAEEVASFLKKKMDKASRSGGYKNIKLSFVGHSIGNIIIRSCLTESIMEPFLKYLYTYVSISGPHLGYLYSSNSLFNSGLWLLKKLKGAPCIHQLTFTDDPDLQNTFFYQLCKKKTLENFKNILLLSSPQDGYVPYHSARIQLCQTSSLDYSKRGQIFTEMLNNCLDQIRAPSSEGRIFMRCDVNFDISTQGMNLNTIIGRAAHIEFLETDIFARFIMWSFPKIFL